MVSLGATAEGRRPVSPAETFLTPINYDDLAGWRDDDHVAALEAFRHGCADQRSSAKTGLLGVDGSALSTLCRKARGAEADATSARRFFESQFDPFRFTGDIDGYLTGYFEPELDGARTADERFGVPIYRRPDDLVKVTADNRPQELPASLEFARRTAAGLVEHPDRAAIEGGALAGRGLELAFIEDPIDAFMVHVQGSARFRLPGGTSMRVSFDGKSGHPYTSIGRILIDRGDILREAMTAAALRTWLAANPEGAKQLMAQNRSFIFFREVTELRPDLGPQGAAGVQLTPGRSLAVDRRYHTFGTPIWLDAKVPVDATGPPRPVRRLMIAQDAGSAIVGPARGDVFVGSGVVAGAVAGRIRHPATIVVLVPRGTPNGTAANEPR